jgi:hypothetical protein
LCTQVNITPEEDKEVSLFVASVIRGAQKKEFLSMMAKKKSNVIVVRSCSSPTISMSPSSTIRRAPGVSPSASWSGAILSGKGDGQSSFLSVETNKLKTTLSQPVVKAPDISPSIQPSASWSGPILSGKGDGQSPFLSFETDKLKTTLSQAVAKGPDISNSCTMLVTPAESSPAVVCINPPDDAVVTAQLLVDEDQVETPSEPKQKKSIKKRILKSLRTFIRRAFLYCFEEQ